MKIGDLETELEKHLLEPAFTNYPGHVKEARNPVRDCLD
ncbi:hypothetical protein Sgly_1306 [Syntrophobotulus glycolicus DSM 8271]|uniref:Uncharacterized protein n=1 Tax=Syntrophobotulus glycolicus (strain DSM 8271 / FlGlyR) TaxID=645991 RepID=F0SVB5_SYNGF|nr:hypothetical protein Sgly_1306 [Syntrophobotulus glycolicus DSM 8271]